MAQPVVSRKRHFALYDSKGNPVENFNAHVLAWVSGRMPLEFHAYKGHQPLKAFSKTRELYDTQFAELQAAQLAQGNPVQIHKAMLSNLTKLMFGIDLALELSDRLEVGALNSGGFRSALSQGVAKNTGENFINLILYSLASILSDQDEILVDKGVPKRVAELLKFKRTLSDCGKRRTISIPIESDLTIYSRADPSKAILVSAKTRLKEIFHIATMWKLLFDMLNDKYCQRKWGLSRVAGASPINMTYVFATADMVPAGAAKSQGGDVERDEVRNLIAMDASFMDYVFVSKENIRHVADSLNIGQPREALFHSLGCIVDLIQQRFAEELRS